MNGKSADIIEQQKQKLKLLFPEVFSENKVDWEKLKATLGDEVAFKDERYVLNWAGKSSAFRALQSPTTATLVPSEKESIDFDKTENLFIEGDNLEVLKALQKSYHGRIKMIYIDPPYNTGEEKFIYPDKFAESKEDYLKRTGGKDESGYITREGLFRKNSKDNGHYHSNWLSMMYPRLFLAKNLLKEGGVIFVSIDDNEVNNLRLILNEIFGEENFVSSLVWEGAIKNDSRFISNSHDYVLCYVKNLQYLSENKVLWRTRKEGVDKIYEQAQVLLKKVKGDYKAASEGLKDWYRQLSKNDPAWQHRHYNRIDKKGVYFPSDISWPGGGGPTYDVLHPVTKKPVRIPARGWVFPKPETMAKAIKEEKVEFGEDENKVPTLKRYLCETEGQVIPSIFYRDRRSAMQRLRKLMDGDVFDNPKDENIIKKLIEATTDEGDIIMDFFAGSATTAHSVIKLNCEDLKGRKFLMVQMPELTSENSLASKKGFKTIADIGKERIRRVIESVNREKKKKPELFQDKGASLDLGFKVFKLQPSSFKSWRSKIDNGEELMKQIDAFEDPIKPDSEEENMVYELMLKSGRSLTSSIEKKKLGKSDCFVINGNDMIFLLSGIDEELVEEVISMKPKKVIALDKLLKGNDQLKTNTVLQMRDAGIDFKTI